MSQEIMVVSNEHVVVLLSKNPTHAHVTHKGQHLAFFKNGVCDGGYNLPQAKLQAEILYKKWAPLFYSK